MSTQEKKTQAYRQTAATLVQKADFKHVPNALQGALVNASTVSQRHLATTQPFLSSGSWQGCTCRYWHESPLKHLPAFTQYLQRGCEEGSDR